MGGRGGARDAPLRGCAAELRRSKLARKVRSVPEPRDVEFHLGRRLQQLSARAAAGRGARRRHRGDVLHCDERVCERRESVLDETLSEGLGGARDGLPGCGREALRKRGRKGAGGRAGASAGEREGAQVEAAECAAPGGKWANATARGRRVLRGQRLLRTVNVIFEVKVRSAVLTETSAALLAHPAK